MWKLRIGIAAVLLAGVQSALPADDEVGGRLDEMAARINALEARIAALEEALEGVAGPSPDHPPEAVPGAPADDRPAPTIDINSQEGIARLTEVPGIGPVLAGRIAEALPVARMADLLGVRGVGEARLGALLDFGYYAEGDVREREPRGPPANPVPEPAAPPGDDPGEPGQPGAAAPRLRMMGAVVVHHHTEEAAHAAGAKRDRDGRAGGGNPVHGGRGGAGGDRREAGRDHRRGGGA